MKLSQPGLSIYLFVRTDCKGDSETFMLDIALTVLNQLTNNVEIPGAVQHLYPRMSKSCYFYVTIQIFMVQAF